MQTHAAVFREGTTLKEGCVKMDDIYSEMEDIKVMVAFLFRILYRIPKRYLPSLATSCENMASHRERKMEKTPKIQIVYEGTTHLCQHSTTDLVRGIMTKERKQSVLWKARSFKHSKTTSSFSYSIYHQRAGKTCLFHMRGGGRYHAF